MNLAWAFTTITVVLAAISVWRIIREPRRPLNGLLLVATVFSLWITIIIRTAQTERDGEISTLIFYGSIAIVLLFVLVTGIALTVNGAVMIRREGVGVTALVPIVFGLMLLGVIVAPFVGLNFISSGSRHHPLLGEILLFVIAPLCAIPVLMFLVELVAFTVYAVLYGRIARPRHADAVVVLGAGLNVTELTPLLAARVDRGIATWRELHNTGEQVKLVLSGGQGADEVISEAEAMSRYAERAGVPPEAIVLEDQSTTTRENLSFSQKILDEQARLVVVTSNYHALRAAALTEELGIHATVVGARTATYFVPAGFLREFVAVLEMYRRKNLIVWASLSLVLLVLAGALFGISMLYGGDSVDDAPLAMAATMTYS